MRQIININVTLNTDIGTVSDPKIGNDNENIVIKKEESDKSGLQKIQLEDRAMSPLASVKSEPMDENKSCVRTEMQLDGQWPHVDVDLIPQSVTDDDVIMLHSHMPVQTDFKDLPKVKSDADLNSLQDILSRTKEARHYADNATGIFRQIPKTESGGTGQKEGGKVVGNVQFLPLQSAGHSMLTLSGGNVAQSAANHPFGGSFNFPSVSMNPFGNIGEGSLTKGRLFGHSSKIATTISPKISPIIAPSRLSLSKLPELWRSTPPAIVSKCGNRKNSKNDVQETEDKSGHRQQTVHIHATFCTFPTACKAQTICSQESGQSCENQVSKITYKIAFIGDTTTNKPNTVCKTENSL